MLAVFGALLLLCAGFLAGCSVTEEPAAPPFRTPLAVALTNTTAITGSIAITTSAFEASNLLKTVLENPSGTIQGIICDVPTPIARTALRPTAVPGTPQPLLVTVSKVTDKAVVTERENDTLIEITSPGGIGETTISWQQDPPPTITLRLHLAGLEGLIVEGVYVGATASVNSSPPYSVTETVRSNSQEDRLPMPPDDRYWIDITWVSNPADGEPEIPIKDGYFEAKLPAILLEENFGSISVRWIDFFR
jgi:hypothetical protein